MRKVRTKGKTKEREKRGRKWQNEEERKTRIRRSELDARRVFLLILFPKIK
jgi:hypothetical protein